MRFEVGQIQVGEIQVRQVEGAEIQPARCCGGRREGWLCGAGAGHGRRFASETGRRFPRRGLRGRSIVLCDMGFALGPRINAGGRVGKSDLGVRLLTTSDPQEAADIAQDIAQRIADGFD